MENTYDIEFDITDLLAQLLRPGSYRSTTSWNIDPSMNDASTAANTFANRNANTTRNNQRNDNMDISGNTDYLWMSMMQRNQMIIDDLLYSYNTQMDRYNQNIERIIQILQSNQTRLHQYITMSPINNVSNTSSIPTYNTTQRRNAIREDGNLIRLLLGGYSGNSSLLYTYLYPNSQYRNSTRPPLSTPEQRANAIQTITYNNNSNPSPENVCAISLLPFNNDEQVSQIKHCMHIFKPEYLNNWLTNYSTCCPICRYDIRNYTSPQSNTNQNSSFNYDSEDTLE
jgi:hypothetical protein